MLWYQYLLGGTKLTEALRRFKSGDFNGMNQKKQSDGSIIISLTKTGESRVLKFRVRNLYQPDEQELDVDTGEPLN
jgi:hypothetical protein